MNDLSRAKDFTQTASKFHFKLFGKSEKHQQDKEAEDNKSTLVWLFKNNPQPPNNNAASSAI